MADVIGGLTILREQLYPLNIQFQLAVSPMKMCAILCDTVKSAERIETQAIGCHSLSAFRNLAAKILHGTKACSYTDNVLGFSQ